MKIFLIVIICLVIVTPAHFYYLGKISQKKSIPGLENARLKKCPAMASNCMCSEFPEDKSHFMPAHNVSANPQAMKQAVQVIKDMGGVIVSESDSYVASTFTSKLFGFVDDFELRLDDASKTLHVRSASRVGQHDVFANKKRIQEFNRRFAEVK